MRLAWTHLRIRARLTSIASLLFRAPPPSSSFQPHACRNPAFRLERGFHARVPDVDVTRRSAGEWYFLRMYSSRSRAFCSSAEKVNIEAAIQVPLEGGFRSVPIFCLATRTSPICFSCAVGGWAAAIRAFSGHLHPTSIQRCRFAHPGSALDGGKSELAVTRDRYPYPSR